MTTDTLEIIKLAIPFVSVVVGSIMSFFLGLLAWWIKSLAGDVRQNSKEISEIKGVLTLLDIRSTPIPKIEKDLNAFHEWKRRMDHEFKRNQ